MINYTYIYILLYIRYYIFHKTLTIFGNVSFESLLKSDNLSLALKLNDTLRPVSRPTCTRIMDPTVIKRFSEFINNHIIK